MIITIHVETRPDSPRAHTRAIDATETLLMWFRILVKWRRHLLPEEVTQVILSGSPRDPKARMIVL